MAGGIVDASLASATITGDKIAAQTITQGLLATRPNGSAAGDIAVSSTCGAYITSDSTGGIQIPNFNITLACTGRPVRLFIQSDASGNQFFYGASTSGGITFYIDGVFYCDLAIGTSNSSALLEVLILAASVPAGNHTFTSFARTLGAGTIAVEYGALVAYEI
jgi:hypothetical protein